MVRNSTMKAVRLKRGEQNLLALNEEPIPELGRYDVLIHVCAASLNYRDQAVVNGSYPGQQNEAIVLSDGAGEVVATGEDVTRTKVGARVAASCFQHWIAGPNLAEYRSSSIGFTTDGWLAEYIAVHENAIVHLPNYLTYVEGASLACAGVTAWTALNQTSPLSAGQTVLVQGTGGTSLFALQIARAVGARVLAITSSQEKADVLKRLGAEAVVNYSTQPD